MAKMNTSHRYVYDAAPATLMRSRFEPSLTDTFETPYILLDKVDGYQNINNELADETLAIIINVTETEDTPHAIAMRMYSETGDPLIGTYLGFVTVRKPGQYVVLLDIPTIKKAVPDLSGLGVALNHSGVGSVKFHAWISQIKKA